MVLKRYLVLFALVVVLAQCRILYVRIVAWCVCFSCLWAYFGPKACVVVDVVGDTKGRLMDALNPAQSGGNAAITTATGCTVRRLLCSRLRGDCWGAGLQGCWTAGLVQVVRIAGLLLKKC